MNIQSLDSNLDRLFQRVNWLKWRPPPLAVAIALRFITIFLCWSFEILTTVGPDLNKFVDQCIDETPQLILELIRTSLVTLAEVSNAASEEATNSSAIQVGHARYQNVTCVLPEIPDHEVLKVLQGKQCKPNRIIHEKEQPQQMRNTSRPGIILRT